MVASAINQSNSSYDGVPDVVIVYFSNPLTSSSGAFTYGFITKDDGKIDELIVSGSESDDSSAS